ncbi:hypothetical protein SEUCBS139899_004255, partial [Sporothrix eucalyptigena]
VTCAALDDVHRAQRHVNYLRFANFTNLDERLARLQKMTDELKANRDEDVGKGKGKAKAGY